MRALFKEREKKGEGKLIGDSVFSIFPKKGRGGEDHVSLESVEGRRCRILGREKEGRSRSMPSKNCP